MRPAPPSPRPAGRSSGRNGAVGVATVTSTRADFLTAVSAQPVLLGATTDKAVGSVPLLPKSDDVEGVFAIAKHAPRRHHILP